MNRVQEINLILAEADPLGLIECGAPSDEYSIEAVSLTQIEATSDLTKKNIIDVFYNWFGEESPFHNNANQEKLSEIYNKIDSTKK